MGPLIEDPTVIAPLAMAASATSIILVVASAEQVRPIPIARIGSASSSIAIEGYALIAASLIVRTGGGVAMPIGTSVGRPMDAIIAS